MGDDKTIFAVLDMSQLVREILSSNPAGETSELGPA